MINIIIHGCGGKMGKVVEGLVKEDSQLTIAAGIDPRDIQADYPVFHSVDE